MNGLNHWGVDVRVNHKHILTIESNCMSGKSDLSDIELEAIRIAGENLLAFAGQRKVLLRDALQSLKEMTEHADKIGRTSQMYDRAKALIRKIEG